MRERVFCPFLTYHGILKGLYFLGIVLHHFFLPLLQCFNFKLESDRVDLCWRISTKIVWFFMCFGDFQVILLFIVQNLLFHSTNNKEWVYYITKSQFIAKWFHWNLVFLFGLFFNYRSIKKWDLREITNFSLPLQSWL